MTQKGNENKDRKRKLKRKRRKKAEKSDIENILLRTRITCERLYNTFLIICDHRDTGG